MTTPEPRVRVRRYNAFNFPYHWQWICDLCLDSHDLYESHADALAGAVMHRCPAMRFRGLLRELEALRDRLTDELANCARAIMDAQIGSIPYWQWMTRESAIRWARSDLTALIDRAGGTGC